MFQSHNRLIVDPGLALTLIVSGLAASVASAQGTSVSHPISVDCSLRDADAALDLT